MSHAKTFQKLQTINEKINLDEVKIKQYDTREVAELRVLLKIDSMKCKSNFWSRENQ